jgi:hypothetical protein
MAWVLVYRSQQLNDQYYESGTGFQTVPGSATTYSTKEATLIDAVTQREALGQGARLVIKDLVSGVEFAAPSLSLSPYLNTISIVPATPSVPEGGSVQLSATGQWTDGSSGNITNSATWSSATTSHVTVSPTGQLNWVASGTSLITCSQSGAVGTVTATAA